MNIGESFGFVFQDSRWITKVLIAAGILALGVALSWVLLIPLIAAAALLLGYGVEITRRVINRTQPLLPEWENWERLIVDGLKVLVIMIVYSLPGILISACLGIPAGIMTDEGGQASGIGGLFSFAASCLSFLWSIVSGLLLPAAIAFFARDGQLSSAFRFSEIIAFVRKNLSNYVIVLVIGWAVGILAAIVGFAVCGIGLLATLPWSYMVLSHLYGEAYVKSSPSPAAPLAGSEA